LLTAGNSLSSDAESLFELYRGRVLPQRTLIRIIGAAPESQDQFSRNCAEWKPRYRFLFNCPAVVVETGLYVSYAGWPDV